MGFAIVPGNATTSNSFYALLGILQCHPEIQDAMVEEIDAVVATEKRVTLGDKDGIILHCITLHYTHYTRAVIYELLRYSSIAPLGAPHMTRKDTQLCGKPVPAGTYVSAEVYIVHEVVVLMLWLVKPLTHLTFID